MVHVHRMSDGGEVIYATARLADGSYQAFISPPVPVTQAAAFKTFDEARAWLQEALGETGHKCGQGCYVLNEA